MNVLWITNNPFPDASAEINLKVPVGAGWVYSAAKSLCNQSKSLNIGVASFAKVDDITEIRKNGMTHYIIPEKARHFLSVDKVKLIWEEVNNKFKPDIIHIHGTENQYAYSYVNACGAENVVVSIQGLVSVIERYYYGGINEIDLFRATTLRDIFRRDTIFAQRRYLRERGRYEKLLINKVMHVIGRTSWDKDHVFALNSAANYHFCNETLRQGFYNDQWDINKCEKFSIFISQAQYPLKGFHQLVKSLPLVLKHYPETKVYVAGFNFFSGRGIRLHGYGKYINSLITQNNLSGNIFFTGLLSENEMCKRYLKSHVFISPSSIENSSNSIGEAQLLGVPCIASYVGGTSDLVDHGETGLLYRFEEVEMLASNICRLFADKKFATEISKKARVSAGKRHDRYKNSEELLKIYSEIGR